MEMRIIATTIILLWSIQTFKCNEGFKPGNKKKFPFSVFPRYYQPQDNNCFAIHNEKSFFFPFFTLLHHSESFQVCANNAWKFI